MSETSKEAAVPQDNEGFLAKLEDEVYRSTRYQIPFSIVFLRLVGSRIPLDVLQAKVIGQLRRLDFAGWLREEAYAIGLPHTPAEGAAVVADRLRKSLAEYSLMVGSASFPDDADDAEGLMLAAELNAIAKDGRSQDDADLMRG